MTKILIPIRPALITLSVRVVARSKWGIGRTSEPRGREDNMAEGKGKPGIFFSKEKESLVGRRFETSRWERLSVRMYGRSMAER